MGAVALPLGIAVLIAEVWPAPELVVSPEVADGVVAVGPLEAAVVIALGASNPGRPIILLLPMSILFPVVPVLVNLLLGYSLVVPLTPSPTMLPVVIPPA